MLRCPLILLAFVAGSAQAAVITSLYSTGVDNAHALLGDGATDPHYKLVLALTSYQTNYGTGMYASSVDGFPLNGLWTPNLSDARWIEPGSGTLDNHAIGFYYIETTFDLTGYIPSTANVTLRLAADSIVQNIWLNGVSTGYTNIGTYSSLTGPLTVNTGFSSGVNTFRFLVKNGMSAIANNPTGLLVEAKGTADVVPEPTTLASLAVGAAALLRRRHARR